MKPVMSILKSVILNKHLSSFLFLFVSVCLMVTITKNPVIVFFGGFLIGYFYSMCVGSDIEHISVRRVFEGKLLWWKITIVFKESPLLKNGSELVFMDTSLLSCFSRAICSYEREKHDLYQIKNMVDQKVRESPFVNGSRLGEEEVGLK